MNHNLTMQFQHDYININTTTILKKKAQTNNNNNNTNNRNNSNNNITTVRGLVNVPQNNTVQNDNNTNKKKCNNRIILDFDIGVLLMPYTPIPTCRIIIEIGSVIGLFEHKFNGIVNCVENKVNTCVPRLSTAKFKGEERDRDCGTPLVPTTAIRIIFIFFGIIFGYGSGFDIIDNCIKKQVHQHLQHIM